MNLLLAIPFFLFDFPPLEIDVHPPLEEEFVIEEVPFATLPQKKEIELIADQKNREALIAYVKEGESQEGEMEEIDPKIEEVVASYIRPGTTVIDYGAKTGASSILCASLAERVIAIEENKPRFRQLYQNMISNRIENIQLYCCSFGEKGEPLDNLRLENVSCILVDAQGREDQILEGLKKTIERCKPALILSIVGGISIENADRYVMQEYQKRLEDIEKLGYSTQQITSSRYLALPASP